MEEPNACIPDRAEWRNWLEKNHRRESVIWLIYYKKHTGKASVPYNDAVEEALCFGWIDSLIRRIDDERYMQKFTPRKPRSKWSASNVRRVEKMIREGKMKEKGMELYEFARVNGLLPGKDDGSDLRPGQDIPDDFARALRQNPEAEKYFKELAPSYRRNYLAWITAARRDETRRKRIAEAVSLLESGEKLGMK